MEAKVEFQKFLDISVYFRKLWPRQVYQFIVSEKGVRETDTDLTLKFCWYK